MADSLSAKCTPLKVAYDACFNAWFEGYLEPVVSTSTTLSDRMEYSRQKALEFEEKCGKVWESYQGCVQEAVKEKGLDGLLQQARNENPLTDPPSAAQP